MSTALIASFDALIQSAARLEAALAAVTEEEPEPAAMAESETEGRTHEKYVT